MLTNDRLCEIALELPGTERGSAWGQPVVKVGKTSLFFWNPTWRAPVFLMSFDERDFWIEADPETFYTTNHHRNSQCVLAHPDKVDEDWVRAQLKRSWMARAPKKLLKSLGY